MHELSLATGILDLVQDAAQRDGFRRVGQLRLEVGALAGVEVAALRFALDAIRPGTCLEDARIDIDTPTGTAWCPACACEVPITGYLEARYAQMVSNVNSSASMNSSTSTSAMCPSCAMACATSAASSQRNVSIEPAPAMGLRISG